MANVLEGRPDRAAAADRLRKMLILGLTGLGVDEHEARRIAAAQATRIDPGATE